MSEGQKKKKSRWKILWLPNSRVATKYKMISRWLLSHAVLEISVFLDFSDTEYGM